MKKLKIDFETADRITVLNLLESRKTLKKELKAYEKDPDSDYMHPDDVGYNLRVIDSINDVLKYFGY